MRLNAEKEKRTSDLQDEINYVIKDKNNRITELEWEHRQTMDNYEINIREMRESHAYNKSEMESRINE
jgi:hypothetical protein